MLARVALVVVRRHHWAAQQRDRDLSAVRVAGERERDALGDLGEHVRAGGRPDGAGARGVVGRRGGAAGRRWRMSPSLAIYSPFASLTARSSSTVTSSAFSARYMRSAELRQSWLPITASVLSGAR